jgi:hypothetical protein
VYGTLAAGSSHTAPLKDSSLRLLLTQVSFLRKLSCRLFFVSQRPALVERKALPPFFLQRIFFEFLLVCTIFVPEI